MNKPITEFIRETLYPEIFEKVDVLFPELNFTKDSRGNWRSPKKLNGDSPKSPRPNKTIITTQYPTRAKEQGEEETKDLITLYKELNKISSDIEAIKELCSKVGVNLPESEEDKKKYLEFRERQDKIFQSHERQVKGLFSEEGRKVLQYLKEERGFSEEEIRLLGFGFISPSEAQRLERETSIGVPFGIELLPLSIPYFSKGDIRGFKFRIIDEADKEKVGTKYKNTKSIEGLKKSNPFGLTSFNQSTKREEERNVIVTEGEIDALRCLLHGLKNVIATTGGAVTPETAQAIKEKGFKKVFVLLDSDSAGGDFIEPSIRNIEKTGLHSFVVEIPSGSGKDPDEFFKNGHTSEELETLMRGADFGSFYLYKKILESIQLQDGEEVVPLTQYVDIEEKVISLANNTPDQVKRHFILNDFAGRAGTGNISHYEKALTAKADQRRETEDSLLKKTKTEEALKKALQLMEEGKVVQARKIMKETERDLQTIEDRNRYTEYLFSNADDIFSNIKNKPQSLKSGIVLTDRHGNKVELEFPSGGLSIIGGATGHGKSKVIQNIVINLLTSKSEDRIKEDETILYFTYEENVESVTLQFLNAFANVEITKPVDKTDVNPKKSNLGTIEDFFRGEDTFFIRNKEKRNKFIEKKKEFKKILDSQRLKIIGLEDHETTELLGLLRFITKEKNIKAIFLDYVQELTNEETRSSTLRTDELKKIMVELDLFVQEYRIPFIMTAQVGRAVNNPLELNNQCLSESGWIERKASEILLMWSNKEKAKFKDNQSNSDEWKRIKDYLKDGDGGVIYSKLTKSRRFGGLGLETFLDIDPNTTRITQDKRYFIERNIKRHFFDSEGEFDMFEEDKTNKATLNDYNVNFGFVDSQTPGTTDNTEPVTNGEPDNGLPF